MQGNGGPPMGSFVGHNGQMPLQQPSGAQQPHRPMLSVTPVPGSIPGMPHQFQNQQAAYRYAPSNPQAAAQQQQRLQSLPDIERLRMSHQQPLPSQSSQPTPLQGANGMLSNAPSTSNNGMHQQVRSNPYPLQMQQMSQHQVQRPPQFNNQSQSQQLAQQLGAQQQHALSQQQQRFARPPTSQQQLQPQQIGAPGAGASLPQQMMRQHSVPTPQQQQQMAMRHPPTNPNEMMMKKDVIMSDGTSKPPMRPLPQHLPPQTLQGFPQQGQPSRPHLQSLNTSMQSNIAQTQVNLQQMNPNGTSTMLHRPLAPQDTQQGRPPMVSHPSRVPSPRPPTPGSLTPGTMTPGNISIASPVMTRSNSPSPSTSSPSASMQMQQSHQQQQVPQRMPPIMSPNDPRYSMTPQQQQQQQQQQLRSGTMTPMQLRPIMMPSQPMMLQGQHPQAFTPAQIEQLQRQQQMGMMSGMQRPPQASAPFPVPMTGKGSFGVSGDMSRRLMGPGMHLSLGAAMRTEGSFEAREFVYTELLLRGLAPGDRIPHVGDQLVEILTGLTGMKPQIGIWKSECWRAIVNQEELAASSGKLIQSQSAFNQELWIKRYAEPVALKDFICLRMYSPEHLVVPSSFPCNARRVNEASASPQLLKLLPTLGFQPKKANNIYCACYLFHHNVGTPESQLMILIEKHFKDEAMTEDIFPGQLVVEVIGRVEEDNLIEPLSKRILDFCRHLQPFVQFNKF